MTWNLEQGTLGEQKLPTMLPIMRFLRRTVQPKKKAEPKAKAPGGPARPKPVPAEKSGAAPSSKKRAAAAPGKAGAKKAK